jgi:ribosomal protein S10
MLTLQLSCKNHALLDESLKRVLTLVPGANVEILPRTIEGRLRRKVEIENPDEKLITRLSKLDISHEVAISVR